MIHQHIVRGALSVAFIALVATVAACNTTDTAGDAGSVEIALTGTSSSGTTYELRPAVFEFTRSAPEDPPFSTTEDGSRVPVLFVELPGGIYTVELQEGWRVRDETGAVVSSAVLLDDPAREVRIRTGFTTPVVYRFGIGDEFIAFDSGQAQVRAEFVDSVATCPCWDGTEGVSADCGVLNSRPCTSAQEAFETWLPEGGCRFTDRCDGNNGTLPWFSLACSEAITDDETGVTRISNVSLRANQNDGAPLCRFSARRIIDGAEPLTTVVSVEFGPTESAQADRCLADLRELFVPAPSGADYLRDGPNFTARPCID